MIQESSACAVPRTRAIRQGMAPLPTAPLMVYGECSKSLATKGYGKFHFLNSFSLGSNNTNPQSCTVL